MTNNSHNGPSFPVVHPLRGSRASSPSSRYLSPPLSLSLSLYSSPLFVLYTTRSVPAILHSRQSRRWFIIMFAARFAILLFHWLRARPAFWPVSSPLFLHFLLCLSTYCELGVVGECWNDVGVGWLFVRLCRGKRNESEEQEGLLELGTCSRGNCDVTKLVLARGASSLCVDFATVDLLWFLLAPANICHRMSGVWNGSLPGN